MVRGNKVSWRRASCTFLVTAVLVCVVVLRQSADAAASLSGSTGYLFVPQADVVPSEHWTIGGMITDPQGFPARQAPFFSGADRADFYFGGFLTVGYLPRVEITVRGNAMPGTLPPGKDVGAYYKDGMFSAQVLAVNGSGRMPSIGFGIQDIYGFMVFNTVYAVATWDLPATDAGRGSLTIGWAVDWYDRNYGTDDEDYPPNHTLSGALVGMELPVSSHVSALVEYDSRSVNVGTRLRPYSWVTLDLAAVRWGLDQLARGQIKGFAASLKFNGAF